MGESKKVKTKSNDLSLKDFYNRRDKVLVIRDSGGLGDILMMRMIFEDLKRVMPEAHITLAIPSNYTKATFWHPYINAVANSKEVDENLFGIVYNLTTACVRYEMRMRPKADKHRAEIWAMCCGVELKNPDMHIKIPVLIKKYIEQKLLESVGPRRKGYVGFAPISNMVSKDLDPGQIVDILKAVGEMGYTPFILHHKPIEGVKCPIFAAPLDQWLAIIDSVDYMITVDTAALHASYGLDKPTVAIFSWADGKVYCKFHKKHILIQRHRDYTPGWTCGPCYAHPSCPKTDQPRKPCITEITTEEILNAFRKLTETYEKS